MTIDFDTQTLELSKGKTWNQGMNRAPDATFSFRWREGVPVMRMTAGEESLCFGLDTGAEINLLSVQKGKKIQEHLTLNQSRRIGGLKKIGRRFCRQGRSAICRSEHTFVPK
jgi:hypothetical protein